MKFNIPIVESTDKIADIVQTIIDCDEPFDVYGVRMDDRLFKVGGILPNSVVWLEGVRTTEELNGKKQLFIEGIFMQSNVVNRNKRRYVPGQQIR